MTGKQSYLFLATICLVVFLSYYSSLEHPFTYLDDQVQVVNNSNIRALSLGKLKAIFSSTTVGMYQPVTTLLYASIYKVAALNPFAYHLGSLLIHLLNVVLIYLFFQRIGFKEWMVLLLTAIFALHPMQVESVAWVSAFSNLVFTAFYLLALITYIQFIETPRSKQLIVVLLFFILACLSKATAISLPFVLILFDFWKKKKLGRLDWLQKIPFLLVSLLFAIITIKSRETAGHLSDLSLSFDLLDRVFLISYSIFFYPFKFLWGFDLSVFYPYPELKAGWLPWEYYASLPLLLLTAWLLFKYRNNSSVWVAVLVYLLTIAPTLQLIPVGNQLTTDRYIYLPMLGLLLCLGLMAKGQKESTLKLLTMLVVLGLGSMTYSRSQVWESDKKLWKDVIQKHPEVAQAYNNLGSYLLTEGKKQEAFRLFDKAVKLKPYYADAYNNRGNLYSQAGQSEKAMDDFNKAIELRPHADAYFNRANELSKKGNFSLAIEDYAESIRLKKSADAYTNRAFALLSLDRDAEAIQDLNNALSLDPTYHQAYFLLAMEARKRVDFDDACRYLKKAADHGNEKAAAGYRELCANN